MKTGNENAIEVLNDLLRINNDRVEGYKKAIDEVKEYDLKNVFEGMADESRRNATELEHEIKKYGGEPDAGSTTTGGKIYRTWMDVKTAFTGKDGHSVLASCEFGEDAAQRAYKDAIAATDLPADARQVIRNQQVALKASHDTIKRYRDGRHASYTKTF